MNFIVVQSRLKLVTCWIWPKGMTWIWPFWWRIRSERTVIPSTVPLALPVSMYSPMRKASSAMKKMPETMSCTRDWEPKLMARPKIEAPAMSEVVLTPRLESAISTATRAMVTSMKMRKTGIMVWSRVAMGVGPMLPSAVGCWGTGTRWAVCRKTICHST